MGDHDAGPVAHGHLDLGRRQVAVEQVPPDDALGPRRGAGVQQWGDPSREHDTARARCAVEQGCEVVARQVAGPEQRVAHGQQLCGGQVGGQVEPGAPGRGQAEAEVGPHVLVVQGPLRRPEALAPRPGHAGWDDHPDRRPMVQRSAPEHRRRPVAEDGVHREDQCGSPAEREQRGRQRLGDVGATRRPPAVLPPLRPGEAGVVRLLPGVHGCERAAGHARHRRPPASLRGPSGHVCGRGPAMWTAGSAPPPDLLRPPGPCARRARRLCSWGRRHAGARRLRRPQLHTGGAGTGTRGDPERTEARPPCGDRASVRGAGAATRGSS